MVSSFILFDASGCTGIKCDTIICCPVTFFCFWIMSYSFHLFLFFSVAGGLLMGNMYTMRPDLFGAIHCAVPLLDMKRFHTLLAGASWMAEYGNPDTDDWNNFL
jgi:hypothetical protein